MKQHITLLLFFISFSFLNAQNLRRQVDLGVLLSKVSQEKAGEVGLQNPGGALITAVVPQGSAAVMEMVEQDIIMDVDGKTVEDPPGLQQILNGYRGGDAVSVKVWRGGKELELTGVLLARAEENFGDGDILYDEAEFKEGFLRTITQIPSETTSRIPALLFIPAYPCTSIDNLSPWHPYKKLVDGLAEKGIAVMRVEKSGMGDCMNTPDCGEVSYETEKEVYKAGFGKLRAYDFVDTNNIFILGHDLGGVIAPVLSSDSLVDPKGIIVYGTILETWLEHLIQLSRYQHPLMGGDYMKAASRQKALLGLAFELLESKRSPKELAEESETYNGILENSFSWNGEERILGRHYSFWQGLQEQNLTRAWAECEAFVLSLVGQSDAQILSPSQHREIVKIVNTYHPDKAQYMSFAETNHVFIKVGSMKEGIEAAKDPETMFGMYQSNFNFEMIDRMAEWIMKKAEK